MPTLEDNKIAARYARALFDAALEAGQLDAAQADVQAVAQAMQEVPQLASFFANPAVPQAEKESLVNEQFANKVNVIVGNTLKLLAANGRMATVPALAEQFELLANKHQNIATAEVITAVEADGKQLEQLQKALEKRFGFNRVQLRSRVEPGILGGAIVKIQDQVIDGSFSGRLEMLKKQLIS